MNDDSGSFSVSSASEVSASRPSPQTSRAARSREMDPHLGSELPLSPESLNPSEGPSSAGSLIRPLLAERSSATATTDADSSHRASAEAPAQAPTEVQSSLAAKRTPVWRDYLQTISVAVGLAFFMRIGIAQAYEVDGPSMEPTMFQNERLFVARCAYGFSLPYVEEALILWSRPSIGDVVIVQSPRDGLDLVKRVIGTAGDVIEIEEGIIIRNGVPLTQRDIGPCDPGRQLDIDETCRVFEETLPAERENRTWHISRSEYDSDYMDPIVVPEDHVFVVGDHRDRSNDSRYFGSVPVNRVRGRVLFID